MPTIRNHMNKFLKTFCRREIPGGLAAGPALTENLFSGCWSPCRARDWKKSFVPTQALKGAFSCFGVQVPH